MFSVRSFTVNSDQICTILYRDGHREVIHRCSRLGTACEASTTLHNTVTGNRKTFQNNWWIGSEEEATAGDNILLFDSLWCEWLREALLELLVAKNFP